MARVGQLFLQQGSFEGAQLLDAGFIADATTNRVADSGPTNGYGYGWWLTAGTTYFADGRGGQLLLIVPRLDTVIVTSGSASPDQVLALRALLNQIPSELSDTALPEARAATRELESLLEAAKQPPASEPVPRAPERAAVISGRDYRLEPNPFGWDTLRLTLAEREARIELELGPNRTQAAIGLDAVPRITRAARFSTQPRHGRVDVAMSGSWVTPDTFAIAFDTIDTIDAGTLRLSFSERGVDISVEERTYLGSEIRFSGTRNDA